MPTLLLLQKGQAVRLSPYSWADTGSCVHKSTQDLLLLADTKLLNDCSVSLYILCLKIIKQPPPLPYEFQKAPARSMILFVDLEMLGKICDTRAKKGYLHLG